MEVEKWARRYRILYSVACANLGIASQRAARVPRAQQQPQLLFDFEFDCGTFSYSPTFWVLRSRSLSMYASSAETIWIEVKVMMEELVKGEKSSGDIDKKVAPKLFGINPSSSVRRFSWTALGIQLNTSHDSRGSWMNGVRYSYDEESKIQSQSRPLGLELELALFRGFQLAR